MLTVSIIISFFIIHITFSNIFIIILIIIIIIIIVTVFSNLCTCIFAGQVRIFCLVEKKKNVRGKVVSNFLSATTRGYH